MMPSKNSRNFNKSVSHNPVRMSMASALTVSSVVQAKKIRELKENDVKKLHNRIALLQQEEEKALKRIEETRQKAH